jgi:Putative beta-barrel porin 2
MWSWFRKPVLDSDRDEGEEMRLRGETLRGARWGLLVGCCAAMWVGLSNQAAAQDWSLSSDISQRLSYDSNLLLTPTNRVNAFGSLTTPHLRLERDSPTSSLSLDAQFKFAEYFGHSELNSQDQILGLSGSKDLSERSTLGLDSHFFHDSTLESDQDIDGRFLTKPVRYITWDALPYWTYELTPIDNLRWEASYRSTNYDSALKTDYRYYGTNVQLRHRLSELADLSGSLSYNRYDPTQKPGRPSDVYGGLVGYGYTPSERFSIRGSVGLNYNVLHNDGSVTGQGGKKDLTYQLNFDVIYAVNDQTKAELTLGRDTEPSGEGLVTRNRAGLTLSYQFSELTTLRLDASYSDNDDHFNSGSGLESQEGTTRYWSIGPSVSVKITDDLSLGASYQLRHKVADGGGGSATDNAAFVTLQYALPEQHWSGF